MDNVARIYYMISYQCRRRRFRVDDVRDLEQTVFLDLLRWNAWLLDTNLSLHKGLVWRLTDQSITRYLRKRYREPALSRALVRNEYVREAVEALSRGGRVARKLSLMLRDSEGYYTWASVRQARFPSVGSIANYIGESRYQVVKARKLLRR